MERSHLNSGGKTEDEMMMMMIIFIMKKSQEFSVFHGWQKLSSSFWMEPEMWLWTSNMISMLLSVCIHWFCS